MVQVVAPQAIAAIVGRTRRIAARHDAVDDHTAVRRREVRLPPGCCYGRRRRLLRRARRIKATCVYRKLRPGCSGDGVRLG
jgi:hypothetical protein